MSDKQKILIVDDDKVFCELKTHILEEEGFLVQSIHLGKEVFDTLKSHTWDIVLLDFNLGDANGIDILQKIKNHYPDLPVIMITAHASVENAVKAIKIGAYDYISKDSEQEEVIIKIRHALEKRIDQLKIKTLEETLGQRYSFGNIIGKNPQMQEVYKLIDTVCNTDVTVLIKGETGTGKELVAKAIHFNSSRKGNPFIPINCAAIHENLMESEIFGHEKGAYTGAHIQRKGKLEEADGGSIFLDEIGDLPIGLQAKLLRFLQDKHFERLGGNIVLSSDVRIISATNKDLNNMVKNGQFREDLFYRIDVVEIQLPPLREKIDDLPILIEHFLRESNEKYKKNIKELPQEGLRLMGLYNWPGNVRELEHLIEKLVLLANTPIVTEQDIAKFIKLEPVEQSPTIPTNIPLPELKKNIEKDYLTRLLKENNGNIAETARKAGIDRKALYAKIEQYGIKR